MFDRAERAIRSGVSWTRIIVFALALMHAVGLADLMMEDACEEVCTDDACADDCLPGVPCRCHCPSTMPLLGGNAQALARRSPPREIGPMALGRRIHANPDPREILHVPKHAV